MIATVCNESSSKQWVLAEMRFFINFAYWYINILFHFEVDKRIGIPVGENLEEKIR